jgi:hypothetical protein
MLEQLIETYKGRTPSGTLANTIVDGHPLYWILIRLIQLGTFEPLDAICAQIGLDAKTVEILFDVASSETPDFPLSITLHNKTRERIIQIDPNALDILRDAAQKISPEHMPPYTVNRILSDGTSESVSTELYLHMYRNNDVDLVSETVSLFRATPGLDDIRIIEVAGKPKFFVIQTPQVQLLFLPASGYLSNGYFADRAEVLDVRAEAVEQVNSIYDIDKTKPIVISTGFTKEAQKVCLHQPKVLLMSIWALLKLLANIENTNKKSAGPKAFTYIAGLMAEGGPGRFYSDSFVNKTINEFLHVNYKTE